MKKFFQLFLITALVLAPVVSEAGFGGSRGGYRSSGSRSSFGGSRSSFGGSRSSFGGSRSAPSRPSSPSFGGSRSAPSRSYTAPSAPSRSSTFGGSRSSPSPAPIVRNRPSPSYGGSGGGSVNNHYYGGYHSPGMGFWHGMTLGYLWNRPHTVYVGGQTVVVDSASGQPMRDENGNYVVYENSHPFLTFLGTLLMLTILGLAIYWLYLYLKKE